MSDAPKLERAKPTQRPATGTDTVTIACDLPTGLIMQVFHYEEVVHFLPNGREIKENEATLDLSAGQYALNGVAEFSTMAVANREIPDYRVIRGAAPGTGWALTSGIPRDFAERWFEDNKRNPVVALGHVKMHSSEGRAASWAKEMRENRSGFQGLNPEGDYRVPNGIRRRDDGNNRGPSPAEEAAE